MPTTYEMPELDVYGREIDQKRKIAEAMLNQGRGPIQTSTYMGGRVAPIHPLQVLASIGQSFVGQKQLGDVAEEDKALSQRRQQMVADELMKVQGLAQGTPQQAPATPVDDEGNQNPVVSATPGNPRAAIEQAIMSRIPELQRYGMLMHGTEEGKLTRAENAAAQKERLQIRAEEQRQRDLDRAEQKERDIRLAASLRPPQSASVTEVVRDGKVLKIDANSGRVIGEAPMKPAGIKAENLRKKAAQDLDLSISELEKATADGGLIDKSTGSGAGALFDAAAGFVGKSTPGAVAAGQMAPIFDLVLKQVPRFEGPQSAKAAPFS